MSTVLQNIVPSFNTLPQEYDYIWRAHMSLSFLFIFLEFMWLSDNFGIKLNSSQAVSIGNALK